MTFSIISAEIDLAVAWVMGLSACTFACLVNGGTAGAGYCLMPRRLFVVLLAALSVVLHRTGFGRQVFVIGNNAEVARYSGVNVAKVRTILFVMTGMLSALAGLFYAARLASVRGDAATGFELDIITMADLPIEPVMKKWWSYMSDITKYNSDGTPIAIDLEEVFYMQ